MTKTKTTKTTRTTSEQGYHWMLEPEAAEYIRVSNRLLKDWRMQGVITRHGIEAAPPCHRRGGRYYYRRDELDAWMMAGDSGSAA